MSSLGSTEKIMFIIQPFYRWGSRSPLCKAPSYRDHRCFWKLMSRRRILDKINLIFQDQLKQINFVWQRFTPGRSRKRKSWEKLNFKWMKHEINSPQSKRCFLSVLCAVNIPISGAGLVLSSCGVSLLSRTHVDSFTWYFTGTTYNSVQLGLPLIVRFVNWFIG